MADETVNEKQQKVKSRSVRLGDRVFLWKQEGDNLIPQPAWLLDYSDFSKKFSLVALVQPGVWLTYPLVPWSAKPAAFHWTFEDQVKPIPVPVE